MGQVTDIQYMSFPYWGAFSHPNSVVDAKQGDSFVLSFFCLKLTFQILDWDRTHLQASGNTKILPVPLIVTFKISCVLPAQLLQSIRSHYFGLVKYFGNTIDQD